MPMQKALYLTLMFTVLLFTSTGFASTFPAPTVSVSTQGEHVDINWTAVTGATGYNLIYSPAPYTDEASIQTADMGNQTSFSTDLWEGAAFYVAVTAYVNSDGNMGTSEYSNIILLEIEVPSVVEDAVGDGVLSLPVVSVSSQGLHVDINWTSVENATGYNLVYAPFPYTGEQSIQTTDMGNQTSFSADLWEGAAFYVAVTAYVESNANINTSEYSNILLLEIVDQGAVDADGDGYSVADGDCDDNDSSIHPSATDIPGDGVDQNCDGMDAILADIAIPFADENLRQCVEATGLPYDQIINLSCNQKNIQNLAGIQNLVNIQAVEVDDNSISDLSPVQGMSSLLYFSVCHNQITDLTPLQGLTNLQQLILIANQIVDLTPLQNLINLQELDLLYNQVSDLSPLQDLINLRWLWLWDNQITDLMPLQHLTNLQELDLMGNRISDLMPLHNLSNLKFLDVSENCITDFTPVSHVPELYTDPQNTSCY